MGQVTHREFPPPLFDIIPTIMGVRLGGENKKNRNNFKTIILGGVQTKI